MIWLDNSRIIAIFAAVLCHVAAGVILGSDIGSEYWWFGNIYDSLGRWCVPVFVMISGALLIDPGKKEDLLTFYKKRLARILFPILFWSVFFLFWAFLKGALKDNEPTVTDLLKKLLSGKPYYHMWFLYMILSLYLFTPFCRKIVANSTRQELMFLVVVTFIFAAINYAYGEFFFKGSKLFINWFLLYIPFFFLGYLIRQDNSCPSKAVLWVTFLFMFILTCMGFYFVAVKVGKVGSTTGLYFYGSLSVSVIPMSISLMYLLKTWGKPIFNETFTKKLSLLTLGVYLIHPAILEIVNYKGYGAMNFHPVISIPVITSIIFLISLTGAWIIHQVPYLRKTI